MPKTLVDKLIESAETTKSIVCFGMDPVLEKMPPFLGEDINDSLILFRTTFMELRARKIFVGAFKPNEGFYIKHDHGQFDLSGTITLDKAISLTREYFPNTPIILDIKRGDIGKSSKNYADHAFNNYAPDAVTVNPYMGTDSVEPFLKQGAAYILCRTSNHGAKDLQDIMTIKWMDDDDLDDTYLPLYMRVAELIAGKWHDISPGNIGAVVGATRLNELQNIAYEFKNTGKQIPLLIPGVSEEGTCAKEVVECLRSVGYDLRLVRINSSSGITEAWKTSDTPYATASADAIQKLNNEIGFL